MICPTARLMTYATVPPSKLPGGRRLSTDQVDSLRSDIDEPGGDSSERRPRGSKRSLRRGASRFWASRSGAPTDTFMEGRARW